MFLIIKYIQMVSCISYTKGTTLKANHNHAAELQKEDEVVFHIPKVRL